MEKEFNKTIYLGGDYHSFHGSNFPLTIEMLTWDIKMRVSYSENFVPADEITTASYRAFLSALLELHESFSIYISIGAEVEQKKLFIYKRTYSDILFQEKVIISFRKTSKGVLHTKATGWPEEGPIVKSWTKDRWKQFFLEKIQNVSISLGKEAKEEIKISRDKDKFAKAIFLSISQ
jgi:hypothetical protein